LKYPTSKSLFFLAKTWALPLMPDQAPPPPVGCRLLVNSTPPFPRNQANVSPPGLPAAAPPVQPVRVAGREITGKIRKSRELPISENQPLVSPRNRRGAPPPRFFQIPRLSLVGAKKNRSTTPSIRPLVLISAACVFAFVFPRTNWRVVFSFGAKKTWRAQEWAPFFFSIFPNSSFTFVGLGNPGN